MSGAASADAIALLLRALVLDVFDEHDPGKRAAAIERIFTADCEFADPYGAYRGHADIEQVVLNIQAKFRGFRFHLTSEAQVIVNGGRITWSSGPPEAPATLRGTDVALVRDGRIAVLLTFMDLPDGTALSR